MSSGCGLAQCQQVLCHNWSHRVRPENRPWCRPSWTLSPCYNCQAISMSSGCGPAQCQQIPCQNWSHQAMTHPVPAVSLPMPAVSLPMLAMSRSVPGAGRAPPGTGEIRPAYRAPGIIPPALYALAATWPLCLPVYCRTLQCTGQPCLAQHIAVHLREALPQGYSPRPQGNSPPPPHPPHTHRGGYCCG